MSRRLVNLTTLSLGKLKTKQLTSTMCTYNWQQPSLNQQKEENDRRQYFPINLHESMGLSRDKKNTPGSAIGLATDCATGPEKKDYSKICLKLDFKTNAGQKYCRMLQGILQYFQPSLSYHLVLFIFEWPFQ